MQTLFLITGILSSSIIVSDGAESPPRLRPPALRPVAIVENRGQWKGPERFRVLGAGVSARLEDGVVAVQAPGGREVRLVLEGPLAGARPQAEEPVPTRFAFARGTDTGRWLSRVPGFARAVFRDPSSCFDLVVSGEGRTGRFGLEYDLVVQAGVEADEIAIRFEGVEAIALEGDGSLILATGGGLLRQSPPVSWIDLPGGQRRPVECRFRLLDRFRFGFELPRRDSDGPVIIDPVLEWVSLLGSEGDDEVWDLRFDGSGDLLVAGGMTDSDGNRDAFVSRLNASSGDIKALLVFGGTFEEKAASLALDRDGNVVLAGYTGSSDFPVTNGSELHGSPGDPGALDAFVARIDPALETILFATYLGGSGEDGANAVEVDRDGTYVLSGWTASRDDFPVTAGAFQETFGGGEDDFFVARIDPVAPAGGLVLYASYLGGRNRETWPITVPDFTLAAKITSHGFLLAEDGAVLIASGTYSADFPTTPGAYRTTFQGECEVVVARLRLDAGLSPDEQLEYSTFIGTAGWQRACEIRTGLDGSYWIAGATGGESFPVTPGSFQEQFKGGANDAFLLSLKPDPGLPPEAQLRYSTLLGGAAGDVAFTLQPLPDGLVEVTGGTYSMDYPLDSAPLRPLLQGREDGFTSVLDPDPGLSSADQLVFSTFLGGQEGRDECLHTSSVTPSGKLAVAGRSDAFDLGVPQSPQAHGGFEGALALFDLRFPHPDFTLKGPDAAGVVRLDAAPSTTPAGTALKSYAWDFGDGAVAEGLKAEHGFRPGRFSIRLTVTNDLPLHRVKAKPATVACAAGDVAPWTSVDVGITGLSGSARLSAGGPALDVCAGGVGIGLLKDSFHFVYREAEGDFDLAAEVGDLAGASTGAQAGLMAREGLGNDAGHASIVRVKSDPERTSLYHRQRTGASGKVQAVPAAGRWLRLARKAGVLAAYHSADGKTWSAPIPAAFNPAGKVLVGFAVAAKDDLSSRNFAAFQIDFDGIAFSSGAAAPLFLRADADDNGAVEITDAVVLLDYLFLGGTAPACSKAADADDSGELDITDPVYVLDYLFLGGPAPPAPFPGRGTDSTPDGLPCR